MCKRVQTQKLHCAYKIAYFAMIACLGHSLGVGFREEEKKTHKEFNIRR